jgi:hypothetical protein
MSQKEGYDWVLLNDDQEVGGNLFGVQGVPMNFYIDRKGKIQFATRGFQEGDEVAMKAMIRQLLRGGETG